MKQSTKGYIYVLVSAILFGFTPILAAISYQGGNNGFNMTFLRAFLPIPVLFLIARKNGMRDISVSQIKECILLSVCLFGCTLQLYSSYVHIPVSVATTLHFLYPVYVSGYEILIQKKKKTALQQIGLLIAIVGGLFFLEQVAQASSMSGAILALSSGVFYAAYTILLDREGRTPLPVYQTMLIISIFGAIFCSVFCLYAGKLTFSLTPAAWGYALSVALLTAVAGCVLYQIGVREIGKADAAVFSLMEPISSIFFGIMLMNEQFSVQKGVGCIMILLGLYLRGKGGNRK